MAVLETPAAGSRRKGPFYTELYFQVLAAILIGGFIVAFAALFTEIAYRPPIWVLLAVFLPLTVIVCGGLLRPVKGVLLAAQFANRAAEARHDD